MRNLIDIHYVRNDVDFSRGTFRARGDVIEIIPAYQYEEAIRIEYWDNEIEKLSIIDSITGDVLREVDSAPVYPAKYFVSNREQVQRAIYDIETELAESIKYFQREEKYLGSTKN